MTLLWDKTWQLSSVTWNSFFSICLCDFLRNCGTVFFCTDWLFLFGSTWYFGSSLVWNEPKLVLHCTSYSSSLSFSLPLSLSLSFSMCVCVESLNLCVAYSHLCLSAIISLSYFLTVMNLKLNYYYTVLHTVPVSLSFSLSLSASS